MASWIDVFSLAMTTLCFVGTILGVLYIAHAISSRIQSTKESLEHRGITVSREGVSVKIQEGYDREDYFDATQRRLAKVLSVVSVGPESHQHALLSTPMQTRSDLGSTAGANEDGYEHRHEHKHEHRQEKHLSGIGLRRSHSGGHAGGH